MSPAEERAEGACGPDWTTPDGSVQLLHGDCLERLAEIRSGTIDVVFADPPYFLSNGGTTCHAGRRVRVDKGSWDRGRSPEAMHAFNLRWLEHCREALAPNGTLWVSGTLHVIHSIGFAMQQLGFKLLNEIVWEKPNPPPNLSCRYFTHASETILWAARDRKSKHLFRYAAMRERNGGKQMKSVWRIAAAGKLEKTLGRHPTQKPLALLERILVASCPAGGRVLDPFLGSGTTAIAALEQGLSTVGIELEEQYIQLAQRRILEAPAHRGRMSRFPPACGHTDEPRLPGEVAG